MADTIFPVWFCWEKLPWIEVESSNLLKKFRVAKAIHQMTWQSYIKQSQITRLNVVKVMYPEYWGSWSWSALLRRVWLWGWVRGYPFTHCLYILRMHGAYVLQCIYLDNLSWLGKFWYDIWSCPPVHTSVEVSRIWLSSAKLPRTSILGNFLSLIPWMSQC